MDLNEINVTGKVMQVTKTGNSNGTKMTLGTIGVYRGKNKETGKPEFDNLPFVAYGAVSDYIQQDVKMMLSGKINVYIRQDGSKYGQQVVQMQVLQAYPIEQPELNANPNLNRDISNALDTLDFDKLTNQLNGASK
ncbi:hypothetical protein C4O30_05610 [Lactiplantibacillus plantarum]|uniref:hypothetical protein n=1 Tax=Lactiplantibacillus plantarum TaxID=1590 RepID=UPI000CCEDB07|nr:hypothetical protein [Lactiplantibacillus plantarum]AVE82494.1 hypothetical protein C4O30_05610 [Lactiplantibacillus plantarum]PNW64233.1 hypothetical protein ACZ99_01730 [Lactobacillus sp. ATCC 15578]